MAERIEVRHQKACRNREGRRCNCQPSYRAAVWSPVDRKRIRKTFPTLAAAKRWRVDAEAAVGKGSLRVAHKVTLRRSWEDWLAGAKEGIFRNRSGDPYKPSVIRSYARSMKLHVLPDLGGVPLADLRRTDLQDLADRLIARGSSASTVRNAVNPVRAVYRRALDRDHVATNPTSGLRLPASRGKRPSIVAPDVASQMLKALPAEDRVIWATAFYAGLRAGELKALRWPDVNLAGGVIRVEQSWDREVGGQEPKSRSGRRAIPIVPILRDELLEHRMRQGRNGEGLVFGRTESSPFSHRLLKRAARIWREAGFEYVTLHEARHTFASLMIAAGEDPKRLQTYMGHSSITVTFDRYGHLMPGSERESAERLNAFLERANTAARIAQIEEAS